MFSIDVGIIDLSNMIVAENNINNPTEDVIVRKSMGISEYIKMSAI